MCWSIPLEVSTQVLNAYHDVSSENLYFVTRELVGGGTGTYTVEVGHLGSPSVDDLVVTEE